MYCGVHADRLVTKTEIAECCNTSENHLAQVINRLAQLGYLRTQRGRKGGLTLGRAPAAICVGDVFRSMESEVPIAECFDSEMNTCPLTEACRLRDVIATANAAFYASMDNVMLDELVCGNDRLIEILSPMTCESSAA